MTSPLQMIAQLAVGLALGSLAGAWHFMSLRWNWPLFVEGRAAAALALQLARFALTGVLLFLLAHVGALALLAGMAGFLLARAIAMRRYGDQR
ncbi:N-ATPase subunit AtpR [Paraburkholderia sp. RL17-337-BIB-A]|uniref:N-ATPase subunit AtpR n=1 Tax=Paraburkholderia sp. RL17-337-BIB-A TaxID=3031636 RepID=UPI0038B6C023